MASCLHDRALTCNGNLNSKWFLEEFPSPCSDFHNKIMSVLSCLCHVLGFCLVFSYAMSSLSSVFLLPCHQLHSLHLFLPLAAFTHQSPSIVFSLPVCSCSLSDPRHHSCLNQVCQCSWQVFVCKFSFFLLQFFEIKFSFIICIQVLHAILRDVLTFHSSPSLILTSW